MDTAGAKIAGGDATSVKPHIVFFLVDDMGYNDIGYNSLDIPHATPFLDELASTGVTLSHYYTMCVWPLLCP